MPNAAEDRIAAVLTMCRKAGRLLLGFDAVKEAAQQHRLCCVLLAEDVSAKTEKEIRYYAGSIPVRKLPMHMDALRAYFRKRTGVFGVCETGFAAKLLALLPPDGQ